MRARSTHPTSLFSAPVAEAVQDLIDRERLPSDLVVAVARGDIGRGRAAKAIHDWSASMEEWRSMLAALTEAMIDADDDQAASMGTIRLGLLDMEESISASLDRHLAAVWMSIPFDARVLRIRTLLAHLNGLLSVAESAETYGDHRTAADGWRRVHDIVEERVRLDPTAAAAAGYDMHWHDTGPRRWGDDTDLGTFLVR